MSISSLQSNIQRAQSDIATLTNKLSDVSRKLADKSWRIADAHNAASRATSTSTQQSKLREIASTTKDIAALEKDKAGVEKKIGDKKRDLYKFEQDLSKEQQRESTKQINADQRRMKEMDDYQRTLDRDLRGRRSVSPNRFADEDVSAEPFRPVTASKYDLFISHATEDKDEFVRPLAEALTRLELDVWYDESTMKLGDSLRESIDKGLRNSRYGVVVVSTAFIAKKWTQYELNGMVAREMNGVKVILPIWHKVSKDEILRYSPTLADKIALNSSMFSIDEIAQKLAEIVKAQ